MLAIVRGHSHDSFALILTIALLCPLIVFLHGHRHGAGTTVVLFRDDLLIIQAILPFVVAFIGRHETVHAILHLVGDTHGDGSGII